MTLADGLRALILAASAGAGPQHSGAIAALGRKLDGPLQVAIVGRAKAGKSTLLNALIGERLAPTDAGECTRIVTWYEHANEYRVAVEMRDGRRFELPFRRASDGQLTIDTTSIETMEVARLVVGWPSSRLLDMTLIDTPGLDSLSSEASARTFDAIAGRGDQREAAAILYLMRHAHRSDIAFLEAFQDRGMGQATPVNSIAILSRPDEIGAGRLDALESARWIARRYEAEPRLRVLASSVVTVAGLLAETAATLEEAEAESLRLISRTEPGTIELLLLSADHFRTPGAGPLTVELREGLLRRFGMFGIRLAIDAYTAGRWSSAADLARLLAAHSGLPGLRQIIRDRFAVRSRQLVNRSVLLGFVELSELGALDNELIGKLEQLESDAHEFAEIAMLDLALSGDAQFSIAERDEAERITAPGNAAERVGCDAEANTADVQAVAVASVARWRERAGDPLANRITVSCAETMARCYERVYADLQGSP